MKTVAIVHVTVGMTVTNPTWSENSTAGQLHREAGEIAVKRIQELCSRSSAVDLIGEPQLVRVYTEEEKRR